MKSSMDRPSHAWIPVLDGDARREALEAISAIVTHVSETRDPHRVRGCPDPFVVLLLAEASRELNRPDLLQMAVERLNQAIATTTTSHALLSLHSRGICGVGWTAEWLHARISEASHPRSRDTSGRDSCAALDAALERILSTWTPMLDYDLVTGLVGFAVYALQRYPRAPAAGRLLGAVLTHLQTAAEAVPEGLTWKTAPECLPPKMRSRAPLGYYNLGVAHGVPGVIAALAHIYRAGIEVERVATLLNGAVTWLLTQQLEHGDGARYPHWIQPDRSPQPGRMAWCYGGLGLSAALMIAGQSMDRPDWQRAAVAFALLESERELPRTGIQNASLCHGAAGNALIFQRFYFATQDSRFRMAARFWFERALAMRTPGEGVGGYRFLDGDECRDDESFLNGSSGVALALLAGTSHVAPSWDRLLLIDIAAPECSNPTTDHSQRRDDTA